MMGTTTAANRPNGPRAAPLAIWVAADKPGTGHANSTERAPWRATVSRTCAALLSSEIREVAKRPET